MRVLIACECSGIVRDAFIARGYDAWSCDLQPTDRPGPHYEGDVRNILADGWDMMIAHPPCTDLAVSGARWFADKRQKQIDALDFVRLLMKAPIDRIAIENPVSIISSIIRKPDQIIQPYWFGDPFMKTTCLWLKNLPKLYKTDLVAERYQACWRMPPSPERAAERAKTYPGVARAMADQWGNTLIPIQCSLLSTLDTIAIIDTIELDV